MVALAKQFQKEFAKFYFELLETLAGLLMRDFTTYEDEECILDLFEVFIFDPDNEKLFQSRSRQILTCFAHLVDNNPDRVAPLFDKVQRPKQISNSQNLLNEHHFQVYPLVINGQLECDDIRHILSYTGHICDVSSFSFAVDQI